MAKKTKRSTRIFDFSLLFYLACAVILFSSSPFCNISALRVKGGAHSIQHSSSSSLMGIQDGGNQNAAAGKIELLSRNKNTVQSTNYQPTDTSNRTVDGNFTKDATKSPGCSHTAVNKNYPWLRIDLGKKAKINRVEITNRGDCCGERLHKYSIFAADDETTPDKLPKNQTCDGQHDKASTNGAFHNMTCHAGFEGRYVTLFINDTKSVISVCEIEVYGEFLSDCASGAHNCDTTKSVCSDDAVTGSHTCVCNKGYMLAPDGITCEDINECLLPLVCDANATCKNTEASFECTCKDGYEGDGKACKKQGEETDTGDGDRPGAHLKPAPLPHKRKDAGLIVDVRVTT